MFSLLRKTRSFCPFECLRTDCKNLSTVSQTFEIVISDSERKKSDRDANVANVGIVLFGYSGSPLRYLQKHSLMYNSLGYRTIACAIPNEYTWTWDVDNIQVCCDRILDTISNEKMSKVVPVCFSNNGALYYQFFSQKILRGECSDVDIVGAIFDSGPGPVLGKFSLMLPEPLAHKPSPPPKLQLLLARLFVNRANRMSDRQSLSLLWVDKHF